MLQRDFYSKLSAAGAALLALSVAGCSGMGDTLKSDSWFSKPFTSVLSREDGSGSMGKQGFALGPSGPVGPEELVNPDGSCAAEAAAPASPAAPAAAQADGSAGSAAGDLAGAPMAGGSALGGVALGMTECQTVRRAGTPSNVSIGSGDNNERKVVLTYLGGEWPGVYTFSSGRLKVVDELPQAAKPAKKPVAKKKKTPAKRG